MHPTPAHHRQAGFTLIEVLVTALIVALLSSAVATALVGATTASGDQRLRSEANTLASQDQERLRGMSDEELAALGGTGQKQTPTYQGTTFTITSTTQAVTASGQTSCAGEGAADFRITSEVSWTGVGGSSGGDVTVDSLIARPTTGDLGTTVVDQTGAPLSGVTVSALQQQNDGSYAVQQTETTDSNGCVLFAGLSNTPTSSYELQYSKTGYVDDTGATQPVSAPVAVSPTGTPANVQETLGEAGSLVASFTTAGKTTGDANAISYIGNGQTTPSVTPQSQAGSTSVTASGCSPTSGLTSCLYPFNVGTKTTPSYKANYAVWAGACAGQKPPTTTSATVNPGPGSSAVTIAEPQLDLNSLTVAGLAIDPTALTLTFTSQGCTDSWSAQPAASTTSPPTAPAPPATGWLHDPGQPYAPSGTLTVCATYQTLKGLTAYGAATTSNSSLTTPTVANLSLLPVVSC